MNVDIIITAVVIFLVLTLFITEYIPADTVAIAAIVILTLSGVISFEQGVKGFANSAVLTVAAMFVMSEALIKTGAISSITPLFLKLIDRSYYQSIIGITAIVGSISAFINNTPVVATFIPVITNASRKAGISPSRYLIPLSYGAIFGGTCTLIGTSTNLLVSGIAEDHGIEGFSVFLMAPLGLVFFVVGTLYLVLFGRKLVPERPGIRDMEEMDKVKGYLSEIFLSEDFETSETTIDALLDESNCKAKVLQVKRGDNFIKNPENDFLLKNSDVVLLKGSTEDIKKLLKHDKISVNDMDEEIEFPEEWTQISEIVILPNSGLIDKKLNQVDFKNKYNARVLAIRQRGKEHFSKLENIVLHPGDILLLQTNEKGIEIFRNIEKNQITPFLPLKSIKIEKVEVKKLVVVMITLLAIIVLASTGIIPIMIGALGGIVVLNVFGIITMNEAYRAIDWKVIFLLAGALSLGEAMNESGISQYIGDLIAELANTRFGPVLIISFLYIITSIFTEMMSNNAAAALLAPVAISVASTVQLSATPLLLAITFAGSASFMTPVGYQTNTMVYSAGGYKFSDFVKVGTPLNLIFWLLATLLIPVFYPF